MPVGHDYPEMPPKPRLFGPFRSPKLQGRPASPTVVGL